MIKRCFIRAPIARGRDGGSETRWDFVVALPLSPPCPLLLQLAPLYLIVYFCWCHHRRSATDWWSQFHPQGGWLPEQRAPTIGVFFSVHTWTKCHYNMQTYAHEGELWNYRHQRKIHYALFEGIHLLLGAKRFISTLTEMPRIIMIM